MLAEIVFIILALIILFGAFKMLNAKELVHSAVWLAVVLGGVAGIYLTLSAELLAAIQILIYVGAVLTLLLFAILFMQPTSTEGYAEDRTPLAVLGIDAPPGFDVESLQDVDDDVATVKQAEERGKKRGAAPSAPPEPADPVSDAETDEPDEKEEAS